jgi:predicted nucleotidyltransferase
MIIMDISNIIPLNRIAAFCQKWQIVELAVFGSILGEKFNENSDVDFLITFSPNAKISLFDLAQAQMDLKNITGREVDLVEKAALRNPFRKRKILATMKVLYAA